MANKKEYYLAGKAKWCKLQGRGDLEYQNWNVVLYLDPPSLELFNELKKGTDTTDGILNEVKQDDDGYYVQLRRPHRKVMQGKETAFTPPLILNRDNLPWEDGRLVGNGSDLTCKIEWYSFKPPFKQRRGSAIRLVSARVDNLVPYEPKKDYTEEEAKQASGLVNQPPFKGW